MCVKSKYALGLARMPRRTECPTCQRVSIGACSRPPTILYGGSGGMAENRATDSRDSRYHDVAGRDEKKNLFRQ